MPQALDILIEPIFRVAQYLLKYDLAPLTVSLIKGMLTPILQETVNFVNAKVMAGERGIKVSEARAPSDEYLNLVTVKAVANGARHSVAGTIFGKYEPRLVRINKFRMEVVPEGHMLFIYNTDRPGVIGAIGTTIGKHNINIARMTVGQEKERGQNIILLTTDTPVTPELVQRLKRWKYTQVLTDGRQKDNPSYLSGADKGSVAPVTIDEDIRYSEQMRSARDFVRGFQDFAATLFATFAEKGTLNLAEVTEWVKKATQAIRDCRDCVIRFLEANADPARYQVTHAVNSTVLALVIGEYLKETTVVVKLVTPIIVPSSKASTKALAESLTKFISVSSMLPERSSTSITSA